MYIVDGICYAGTNHEQIEVSEVDVLEDMMMLVTFSSGETRLFDASCLKGDAFEPLKNEAVFLGAKVDDGVVCWADGEIDCAPEYMYQYSYAYERIVL